MPLNGADAKHQVAGDLLVAFARGYQIQHLKLARCEVGPRGGCTFSMNLRRRFDLLEQIFGKSNYRHCTQVGEYFEGSLGLLLGFLYATESQQRLSQAHTRLCRFERRAAAVPKIESIFEADPGGGEV